MLQSFSEFIDLFNERQINYINENINQILQNFKCFLITYDNQQTDVINQRENQSNIIIVDKISKDGEEYLIICFDETVIIISILDLWFIKIFFENHKDSTIYILSKNVTRLFSDSYRLIFPKYSSSIKTYNFLSEEHSRKSWNIVIKCIFTFLIEKSLSDDNQEYDRINIFEYDSKSNDVKLEDEDFFTIRHITTDASILIDLIYHFEAKKAIYLKIFSEDPKNKLFNSEHRNFMNIKHPLVPQYYGYTLCDDNKNGLAIECVNGLTLDQIEKMELEIEEKIKMIFEIMTLIEYFHDNHFVCRDLSPNHFLVDSNKTVILTDVDHLLYNGETDNYLPPHRKTKSNQNGFVAPEISENCSSEVDIYSFGMLLYFIVTEEVPKSVKSLNFDGFTEDYLYIQKMILQCTSEEPSKRPKISELIDLFYTNVVSQVLELKDKYFSYWLFVSLSKLTLTYEEEKSTVKAKIYMTKVKSLMTQIIDNKDLQEIYLKFKMIYCEDETKIVDYLSNSKFITFSISDIQKHRKGKTTHIYGNVVMCSEGICIIFNNTNVKSLIRNLNRIEACLANASEQNSLIEKMEEDDCINEEIDNFCNYYRDDIRNNQLIQSTIRPIVAFMIRRYFCPSSYFKDQSFFVFDQSKNNILNRSNLNEIFFSQPNPETLKERLEDLYEPIFNKQIESLSNASNSQYLIFKQSDFIVLRELQATDSFTDELVFHIKNKYVFMLKRINKTIDKEKFTKIASHDSFVTFYGFLEEGKKVTGLVYDYLCNGKLTDHVTDTEQFSNFYPLISLIRIFHGFDYINDYCQNRPKIDLSIIYLDHDNIPYIYYVFFPGDDEEDERKEHRNRSPLCINFIGEIIYLVFEKKELPRKLKSVPPITKCTENIQNLYYSCISYRKGDKLTFDKIEDSIFNELESLHFVECYLNKIQENLRPNEIVNFCYELIQLLVYMKRNDNSHSAMLILTRLPLLLVLKMTGDFDELHYQIGLLYEHEHLYDKAREYYELSIKKGHSKALFQLGHLYENGTGVRQDYSFARKHYEMAAKNKNIEALLQLGILHEEGKGVKPNSAKAREYFMQAVNEDNSNVPIQIGDIYYNEIKDSLKAIEYYTISANNNNPLALFKLGNIYERQYNALKANEYYEKAGQLNNSEALVKLGDFYYSKPLLPEAKKYYEMAIDLKNPQAFFKLGQMYKDGYGVVKDDVKASKYLNEYIELQSSILLCLGLFNESGFGVEQNYSKAKEYYNLALELNDPKSLYHLGLLYKNGHGVHRDLKKCEHYLSKLQEVGYHDIYKCYKDMALHASCPKEYYFSYGTENSQFLVNIGNFYEKGSRFQKNCLKAKLYYEISCGFQNSDGFYRLGRLYEKGSQNKNDLISQNYVRARDYYLISIGHNNVKAYYRLGNIFERGLADKQDYSLSRKYFQLSASANSMKSYFRLGVIYLDGLGVKVNVNKAIENFNTCTQFYQNLEIYSRYNFYYCLSSNYLGLIYITSFPETDMENAEIHLREGHYGSFSYSQNNLGLLYLLFTKKTGNAEFLFEEAGKQGFALAYYNLGFMNEQNEEIEKAIYFYNQASKNEDAPLIFKNKLIEDEYLEISKTFIICLTNLKLTIYYLSKKNYTQQSEYYFQKVFNKMKTFSIELDFKARNIFANLKPFILNYEDFHLFDKNIEILQNRTKSRKIILPDMNKIKKVEKRDDIGMVSLSSSKLSFGESRRNERKIFTNPKDLFAFAVQNDTYKEDLFDEIEEIINEMDSILYQPPYRILFGRMCSKSRQRPQSLAKPLLPKT